MTSTIETTDIQNNKQDKTSEHEARMSPVIWPLDDDEDTEAEGVVEL